jgi:hypothetical protein
MDLPAATPPRVVVTNRKPGGLEQLCLPASPRLNSFLEAAAQVGLDAPLAVRLAIERALVLLDGRSSRMDVERICRILNIASHEARAKRPLSTRQAAYVRSLYDVTPKVAVVVEGTLEVELPEELITRADGTVSELALHAEAVGEMLAWERAARLHGYTMTEWALKVLVRAISAR